MTTKAPAVLINEDDFEIGYSDAKYIFQWGEQETETETALKRLKIDDIKCIKRSTPGHGLNKTSKCLTNQSNGLSQLIEFEYIQICRCSILNS